MFLRALRFVAALLFGSVDGSTTWTLLAWLVRLAVFSLLLRNYIIPWLLSSTSKHIRVRSISLRSIRGLYVCTGAHVCRIERITYAWAHVAGARRINIIIEGLNLQVSSSPTKKTTRHKRSLTLADFSPSPLARLAWERLGDLYGYVDPYIRPRLRTWVVNRIRFFLRWLPRISQAVTFDLHAAVITLPDMQKMEINVEGINLHTALSIIQSENPQGGYDPSSTARSTRPRRLHGSAAWRKRFQDGFQRSLDRALGDSRAAARISLQLQGLHVSTLSDASECKPLVQLPGRLDLDVSVSFSPRAGTIDEQSLETTVRIGDCVLHADSLVSFLNALKESDRAPSASITVGKLNSNQTKEFSELSMTPMSSNSFRFSVPSIPLESPFFSPSLSSRVPSISAITSPASPLIEAISASFMSHRLRHVMPSQKLRGHKCNSTLSFLQSILVTLSRVSIVYIDASAGSEHSYRASMQDISFKAFRSSSADNPFHVDVLGRHQASEKYDPEVYGCQLSIGATSLERHTITDVWHVLSLGRLEFQALVSQWPSPWLTVSPFMSSDPNAAILALRGHVDSASITERLEDLHLLLRFASFPNSESTEKSQSSSVVKPFPRVFLQLSCGPLVSSIICKGPDGYKPLVVELKTKGVNLSASSHYQSNMTEHNIVSEHEVRMLCETSLVVEPIFAIVHPNTTASGADNRFSEMDLVYHPTALSVETIDLRACISATGQIDDRVGAIACIDTSTLTVDAHISGDAFCVELWHPDVVATLLQILTALPSRKVATPKSGDLKPAPASPGFSLSMGLARLVVFVTSPDLNPQDDLNLSRGIALRSAISVHSCSLATKHLRLLGGIHEHSLARQELDLPQDICLEASAATRSLDVSTQTQFLRLAATGLLVRGAVATPVENDDPHIIERDGDAIASEDFLRVQYAEFKMSRNARGIENSHICINIPTVNLDFHLSHVYESVLALQTLRSIQQVLSVASTEPPKPSSPLQLEVNISIMRIVWILPRQTLLSNIRDLKVDSLPDGGTRVGFAQAQFSTPCSSKAGDDTDSERQEELLRLQSWTFQLPQDHAPPEIVADGDNALVRIPFGYVVADLVLDVTVVAKALRHIILMAKTGRYESFPMPAPEGPKVVPQLKISTKHISLEAADDPFESQLGLIWRAGLDAVKTRLEREKAFETKVAIIHAAETGSARGSLPGSTEYRFDASHTISVKEARQRLDEVHTLDWVFRLEQERRKIAQAERTFIPSLRSTIASVAGGTSIPDSQVADNTASQDMPPLVRAVLFDLDLRLSPPSFAFDHLSKFLFEQGGLPNDTQYTMLVPLHIHLTLSALHTTLRDYPLPLVSIPAPRDGTKTAFEFDTDLVIAEELGTDQSVDWVECPLIMLNQGAQGVMPFSLSVPKAIMPVKSYANPIIKATTDRATMFTWGVSYGPAIQDLMRIIDTLTTASQDESPPIGFWDKLKLIFHWTFRVSFASEVLLHLKGSRNPHDVNDAGAGFVFCWQGNTNLLINRENSDREVLQVISDSLMFAIPDLNEVAYDQSHYLNARYMPTAFRKVCAKFQSRVRLGVGIVLERSCGITCPHCSGPAFGRKCRIFDFAPHYHVKLEKKKSIPYINSPDDTYNGFRSDFIHLSVSLVSLLDPTDFTSQCSNSFHLSSKVFAHFWSWWTLFDSALSLPVRQGTYYPRRMVTPKLGRHLATIKYRLLVPHLFLMHGYLDDTEETWSDGVSPWVGLKGMIDYLQADFHQRDEEDVVSGTDEQAPKILRRKEFYAAEVVLKGIDLRALVATFPELEKRNIAMSASIQGDKHRSMRDLPATNLDLPWYDPMDFVETDWSSTETPELHILPIATCPYFAYFKRNTAFAAKEKHLSKFGVENSHTCLLETELSLYHVQISLVQSRIAELEKRMRILDYRNDPEASKLSRMITLLQEYISLIESSCVAPEDHQTQNYLMPSESVSPGEWADFDNVYQVHNPTLYLDAPIRDILMRYYYCSRARRGFEYHLATRAVKFIRDQANATIATVDDGNVRRSLSSTQAAASALRKLWKNDFVKTSEDLFPELTLDSLDSVNPLDGWSDGVSLQKSHYCLLLKPQVVLRGEFDSGPCVVAATQTKLQSFVIMDDLNADDPISGRVMTRNYTALLGLQAFSPSNSVIGKGRVPLEVLIDLKCESGEFERLVPQTDAMFHYDKFNRLRLRSIVNSAVMRTSKDSSSTDLSKTSHLRDETDLIRIHIPRFTVLASDKHFQSIAQIVSELLLFSDAAHKTRLERLESLLIKYDFTDLYSAATVVENLQHRLRDALEAERQARLNAGESASCNADLLNIRARIFVLAEELHLLFDAIRLAQDQSEGKNDRKSALLLHASSSVLSWNMLAGDNELISKLEVQDTNFFWLSRQDGSTVNNLKIGNLEAFDGSQHAQWAEILSKYDEPPSHPLLKKGLFLVADWIILAPVGGIEVYETFELSFHPIRLQIDAKVGRRIMEYLWPARKERNGTRDDDESESTTPDEPETLKQIASPTRTSLDSPRTLYTLDKQGQSTLTPPMRKLASSRSFTDLRSPTQPANGQLLTVHPNRSVESLTSRAGRGSKSKSANGTSDAADEMKARLGQKTFILVKIHSLDVLLSALKEGSFECHDARIKTRQLEYHDKTWSFEELVDQFIPSNMTWRGWLKMALQQPLVPVFPVARELLMKTKFSRTGSHPVVAKDEDGASAGESQRQGIKSTSEIQKNLTSRKLRRKPSDIRESEQSTATSEPEVPRRRVLSIFGRNKG